jgi:hypothetical protein
VAPHCDVVLVVVLVRAEKHRALLEPRELRPCRRDRSRDVITNSDRRYA